jgi:penicillin amidase
MQAPVHVYRDAYGIPAIFASNPRDLFTAQGFVHAQDRLWQMETVRRITSGTLSQVSGEDYVLFDYFVRVIGLPQLKKRAVDSLSTQERAYVEAYVEGVNAFIDLRGENLPLEFRTLDLQPEPWTAEDVFSYAVYLAWLLQTNYSEEILALQIAGTIDADAWNLLFPSSPGARLPAEPFFDWAKDLAIAPLHPAATSMYEFLAPSRAGGGGSNNWAVAESAGGAPILANDPHLLVTVPAPWYFCRLNAPGIDLAGASLAGYPGIVIGHNGRVAWGLTNVQNDCLDLFVLKVDPRHPTHYYVGEELLEMKIETIEIPLPGGEVEKFPLYHTIFGPVVTQVSEGSRAVAALKWYGTLPEGELPDTGSKTLLHLCGARSVEDALEAGKYFRTLGQNLLVADVQGHIGFHAAGAVPQREGYSGRLPADGSSGRMDWIGFKEYESLPSCIDPEEGWLATANQRTVPADTPEPPTYSWCTPYRYQRIAQLLAGLDRPSLEDFQRMQTDCHSLQAERLVPKILSFSYSDSDALTAVDILTRWDCTMTADSAGAAVFHVFLSELTQLVLEDELGAYLDQYYLASFTSYAVQDVILDHLDSPLWDRTDTPQRESAAEILETALSRTVQRLNDLCGRDSTNWRWGKLHAITHHHSGASGWFSRFLLDRGPYPIGGDGSTINAMVFVRANEDFDVVAYPSARIIMPLNDLNATVIIGPMGQSGQPGHPHYDDMNALWEDGGFIPFPFSRELIEARAESMLILESEDLPKHR